VFTSYATLEVRLIIHETTITLGSTHASLGITQKKETMEVEVDSKAKRTYARSLFKDDEIRTLLMAKFHQ
jgi:hypothetical protein